MTAKEFEQQMRLAEQLQIRSDKLRDKAYALQQATIREAGLEFVDRGPGFNGWRFEDGRVKGWFASDWLAMEAQK